MIKQANRSSLNPPDEILGIWENAPLLASENSVQYQQLLDALANEVAPTDVVEWLWIKDIADLTWEVIRLRRFKAIFLNNLFLEELDDQIENAIGYEKAVPIWKRSGKLAIKWLANPTATDVKRKLDRLLERCGLDVDRIFATTSISALRSLEPLERVLASAELRRNNALHQIEYRRHASGRVMRQASDTMIENEAPLVPLEANSSR
jgi:hypothetical protein